MFQLTQSRDCRGHLPHKRVPTAARVREEAEDVRAADVALHAKPAVAAGVVTLLL